MKPLFLFLFIVITASCFGQNKDEIAIKNILANQERSWNEGSLEKYMIGYCNHDSLLFIGKNGPYFGYKKL